MLEKQTYKHLIWKRIALHSTLQVGRIIMAIKALIYINTPIALQ
jgi:hypothetical protein